MKCVGFVKCQFLKFKLIFTLYRYVPIVTENFKKSPFLIIILENAGAIMVQYGGGLKKYLKFRLIKLGKYHSINLDQVIRKLIN